MPFNSPILAGETLIRSGAKSENYDPGVAGWRIARSGSAEFLDLLARGQISTGISGERLVIPAGIPQLRAYPSSGDRIAILYSTTIMVDGIPHAIYNLQGATHHARNRRGIIEAGPFSSLMSYYDIATGSKYSWIEVDNFSANIVAPYVEIAASEVHTSAPPRIWFRFYESSGAKISSAEFDIAYNHAARRPIFRCNAADQGIQFNSTDGEMQFTNYTALAYKPVRASAFNTASSRDTKRNIRPVPGKATDIFKNAPTYQWEYADGGDPRTHVFPLAEDLPSRLTHADESGNLITDLRDMLGEAGRAIAELTERVERLESANNTA